MKAAPTRSSPAAVAASMLVMCGSGLPAALAAQLAPQPAGAASSQARASRSAPRSCGPTRRRRDNGRRIWQFSNLTDEFAGPARFVC